jgi:hypothetical protein
MRSGSVLLLLLAAATAAVSCSGPPPAAASAPDAMEVLVTKAPQEASHSTETAGDAAQPADPFPPEDFEGWKKTPENHRFQGAELYGYIDGGAEVFLELGFDHLDVRHYKKGDGAEVVVEIYFMTDETAALGAYLLHTSKEKRCDDLPSWLRHTASRFQLQLVRGAAYAKLNNPEGDAAAGEALPRFAAYLAEHLKASDSPERILAALPAEGRVEGTERILRGPFTLERVFTFGEGDILQLKGKVTALSAGYESPDGGWTTLILVEYPDEEACRAAFAHLCENLDSYMEKLEATKDRLVFKDYAGKFGEVRREGASLRATVGLSAQP